MILYCFIIIIFLMTKLMAFAYVEIIILTNVFNQSVLHNFG